MEDGYIGEIRMFGGNFAPKNWYFCDGSKVSISENTELFAIIGTYYGGNGRTKMKLPNFQGVFPMGFGSTYSIGASGGSETSTLKEANLPAHQHPLMATTTPGDQADPTDALLGNTGSFDSEYVKTDANLVEMSSDAIGNTGEGKEFKTMPPYTAISFIICHTGTYPSRS